MKTVLSFLCFPYIFPGTLNMAYIQIFVVYFNILLNRVKCLILSLLAFCCLFVCVYSWLRSKEFTCKAGDTGSISGSGRAPGSGNSNPLQYSCPENPMDLGAWWATVYGVTRVGHNLKAKLSPSPPLIFDIAIMC